MKRPGSQMGWIAVLARFIAVAAGVWHKAADRQVERVAIVDFALAHDTMDDLMAAVDLVVEAVPAGPNGTW